MAGPTGQLTTTDVAQGNPHLVDEHGGVAREVLAGCVNRHPRQQRDPEQD